MVKMRWLLHPRQQKRQQDSRSPKPVGIDVAADGAKRLGVRLSFCRFLFQARATPSPWGEGWGEGDRDSGKLRLYQYV